jgi:phytoene/squalene synthetase
MSDAATPASAAKASGSSFYTAMKILPPQKRDAMYAV